MSKLTKKYPYINLILMLNKIDSCLAIFIKKFLIILQPKQIKMKFLFIKLIFGVFIALFYSQHCKAQLISKWKSNKYFNVDIHVENTPDSVTKDVNKLANYLTRPFGNEEQKIRAIYYWITHNIVYDVDKLLIITSNVNNYTILNNNLTNFNLPNSATTLKLKKGVCGDYAKLFTELCHLSRVACYTVSGWSNVGGSTNTHAWNVVRIGQKWHLVESTWGSGGIDMTTRKFQKSFSEDFFLQSPQEFIKNHYPTDPMWQLLEFPSSYKDFANGKNTNTTEKLDFQTEISQWIFQNLRQRLENSIARSKKFAKTDEKDRLFVFAKQELSIAYYNEAVYKYNRGVNLYNKYVEYNNNNLMIPYMFRKRKSLALLEASEDEIIDAVEMLQHSIFQDDCCKQSTYPMQKESAILLDRIDKDKKLYGSSGKQK
jgi:hypothetical protein